MATVATEIEKLISELFEGKFEKKISVSEIISQPNVWLFTHEEDERIVAMTSLYLVNLFSRKLAVIEEVVTLKEYRNKGIGSGLVKEAIEKARELKATCVELTVREDKPEVQKFYEDLGFYDRKNKSMRMWLNK